MDESENSERIKTQTSFNENNSSINSISYLIKEYGSEIHSKKGVKSMRIPSNNEKSERIRCLMILK